MVHGHPVVDYDKHFIIDPITRNINNAENKKNTLIQNDHNSERFSFELDKEIEGHDMLLCNKVEVHYINTASGSRLSNIGVYEVDDLKVSESDPNKLVFSWLVSENGTKHTGTLSFLVKFACVEDTVCTYKWHTGINVSLIVAKGMDNGEAILEDPYPDILEQWREKLFLKNYAYEEAVAAGFKGTEEDWYNAIVAAGIVGDTAANALELATEAKELADNAYNPENLPPYPVSSVNGVTGSITVRGLYSDSAKNRRAEISTVSGSNDKTPMLRFTNKEATEGQIEEYYLTCKKDTDGTLKAMVSIKIKGDAYNLVGRLYDDVHYQPKAINIGTGGSEGQICAVNSNGTISPNARTIASLGTGATYSLNGATLTITTL